MPNQYDQLSEIAKGIRMLNKNICCVGGTGNGGGSGGGSFNGQIISSCQAPVYTSWCESTQLFDVLDDIKQGIDDISITADNIYLQADEINLNVDTLEALGTTTNSLLTDINTKLQRGSSCGAAQFVSVCNQISLANTENALGNILTQVSAINVDTDKLAVIETDLQNTNGLLGAVNGLLANIRTDTASTVTNTATNNTLTNNSNTLLTAVRDHVKVLTDLRATYQPIDCAGNNYGSPIDVIPVIVSNPVNTSICNTTQLATEIGQAISFPAANNYNTVTQQEITTGSVTIAANTVHAISYIVLSGTCNITIGGNTSTYTSGESSEEEATTLINIPYTFAPAANSKVRLKTIRP